MKKLLLLPALFAAGIINGQTMGATWQDTSPFSAASPSFLDGGIAVTYDASGNIFTVGTFTNSTTIGSDNLSATGGTGDRDVYVAKYNSSGTCIKAIKLGSNGLDDGFSIAWKADQSGNGHVFVTGYFRESTYPLVPTGRIYKLDDDGTPLTVEAVRDLGTDVRARSIFSYGTDRLMVGGSFMSLAYLPKSSGTLDLTASNINSGNCSSGCYDAFTGIIDMSAYFLYAGNPHSSTNDNEIMAIHCRNGYIYTTGYFKGDLQWKSTSANMTAAGVQDAFVASVYMSGSLNQCTFNTDQMQAGSIESQPSGAAGLLPDWKECGYGIVANGTAIYVTGNLNNASTPLFDGSSYAGAGAFVTRVNYSGSQLGTVSWVRASETCGTSTAVTKSIGYGIVCDDQGNVWATGSAYANVEMDGGSNADLCIGSGSERPGFICRYDASGNILAIDQINQSTVSSIRCEGRSIAANGCNMVTTGWDGSGFSFQAGALPLIGVTGTACSAYIFGFNREAIISNSIYSCTSCAAFPLTGSLSVSVRGGTGYSWSPTTYLTNYNTATPSYSVTACTGTITTYYATVTSSVCPTAVIPFTFATVVQSAANAGADISVCPNSPEQFGTAGVYGYSYNWYPITNLGSTYNVAQPTYTNTTTLSSPRTYQVTATDWCGNVTVDYVVLSNDPGCRTANPNGVAQKAEIFPNPSTGIFTVNLPAYESESAVDFTVTDLTGRTVQQNTVTTAGGPVAIDLSGQAKGVYMLSVTRNGETEVHQLIVE